LIAGEFVSDHPHGRVALIAPNGFSFFGKMWQNKSTDTKNFRGQFIPKNKKYDNFQKGIGVVYGDDGSKYVGAFIEGKAGLKARQKTWVWYRNHHQGLCISRFLAV
jgi:hypothetical protein